MLCFVPWGSFGILVCPELGNVNLLRSSLAVKSFLSSKLAISKFAKSDLKVFDALSVEDCLFGIFGGGFNIEVLWEVLNVGIGNGTSGNPELLARLGFSSLFGANGSLDGAGNAYAERET